MMEIFNWDKNGKVVLEPTESLIIGIGSFTSCSFAVCPDLLTLDKIGEADNLRGRIVRAFFRLLDRLMPVR